MRPVGYAGNEAVFYGIDVDVVDVTCEVVFIPYRVLPVTPLPNTIFSA